MVRIRSCQWAWNRAKTQNTARGAERQCDSRSGTAVFGTNLARVAARQSAERRGRGGKKWNGMSVRVPRGSTRFRGRAERIHHGLRLRNGMARIVFPNSPKQERGRSGGGQKPWPAWGFWFRVSAERL